MMNFWKPRMEKLLPKLMYMSKFSYLVIYIYTVLLLWNFVNKFFAF